MASVKNWTAAAKQQHGGGVLAAAPAESNPIEDSLSAEVAAEAISFGVPGLVFGGAVLVLARAKNTFLRIKNRDKRAGTRGMNDLVALLFYEDLVEVRQRKTLRKTTGELLEWHRLEEVTFFDANGIRIGGTAWRLCSGYPRDLEIALTNIGIEIETEEPSS